METGVIVRYRGNLEKPSWCPLSPYPALTRRKYTPASIHNSHGPCSPASSLDSHWLLKLGFILRDGSCLWRHSFLPIEQVCGLSHCRGKQAQPCSCALAFLAALPVLTQGSSSDEVEGDGWRYTELTLLRSPPHPVNILRRIHVCGSSKRIRMSVHENELIRGIILFF